MVMHALIAKVVRFLAGHWAAADAGVLEAAIFWAWCRDRMLRRGEMAVERRCAEEIAAYEAFHPRIPPQNELGVLAKCVCRLVDSNSKFSRVAVLGRGEHGGLEVLGSVGVDDIAINTLNTWAKGVQGERRSRPRLTQGQAPERIPLAVVTGEEASTAFATGTKTFDVVLGPGLKSFWPAPQEQDPLRMNRATVVPCWSAGGRMLGALVVRGDASGGGPHRTAGLEVLAAKLARVLETSALADRLMKAERLASLGQIAGGVAHALSNPLTAVLGFAELIAMVADQPRVQKDAETIREEALRMRETVQRLLNFSRPGAVRPESVVLPELLSELAVECRGNLDRRHIHLVIETEPKLPRVRGNKDRLRQVLEHLLKNAAQAIAVAQMRSAGIEVEGGEEHLIRISVTQDRGLLQVIVSDTGTGFREPGKIFDPYSVMQEPCEGAGLGLSICFGIVREHGGEISAFNLHPRGAAVVVELPASHVMEEVPDCAVA